ncbi:Ig-like domain-containing protein [Mycolicibacterium sp. BiH015]|uniref:Ig-like domain-containing protein n=1 Tax=Mycolicibacterium sp. BiH015 TaxID=3018808 RepID=UPI0022E6BB5C|nr:Ig-like domain-containing protein [Mycolicibacterium sp. BiH015]MDA2892224.1 Ig-like domain-containing protein [Mycolicibacterium sp. BiH015]
MGAALLGFSLVGPDAATARADTGSESSPSSESSDSADAKDADSTSPATERTRSTKASRAADADDESGVATDTEPADDAADESDDDDVDNADAGKSDPTSDLVEVEVEVEEDEAAVAEPDVDSLTVGAEFDSPAEDLAEPATQSASSTPPYQSELSPYQKAVAEILQSWTARHQTWVDSLDVSQQRKDRLTASFLAMRRTFFNQAPTVAPIQITGVITGPIVGTVGAFDPDGDRLVYIVTRAPKAGEVKLSADGTYTYVPDEDFDGVDTFHVAAIDIGLHMNLLQPLRPIASGLATSLINQGAVTFDFKYTAGSDYWTDESRDALQRAADLLIEHFRVVQPLVLSYDVTGFEDKNVGTIANAYGLLTNEQSGFWRTRIQHEMITGEDLNGQEADGYINVNFAKPLAFGDDVGLNQLDFTTTIMHELLHSFGFAFGTGVNGRWHYFARFIVTDGGNRLVNDDAALDLNYQLNVVGGNNGLFFGGANAVAANGGQLVRIYTPNPVEPGSSLTHLDLQTFENLLMSTKLNGGPGVRTLSNLELGIFKDLGYTVVPLLALPAAV